MNDTRLAEFHSVEAIDPTTITLYPDRVVLTLGDAEAREDRVVPISEVEKVKVRTLFGISSLLLKMTAGPTIVADLMERSDAQAAKEQIEQLLSQPASEEAAEDVA